MNYVFAIIAIILGLLLLKFILKLSIKIFVTIFIIITVLTTVTIAIIQPKMHKEFNFNVIEKILKINADGSTSVIQTTTTTERHKGNK